MRWEKREKQGEKLWSWEKCEEKTVGMRERCEWKRRERCESENRRENPNGTKCEGKE